jgi:hypothetical protein
MDRTSTAENLIRVAEGESWRGEGNTVDEER